jgi:hypothetical protein
MELETKDPRAALTSDDVHVRTAAARDLALHGTQDDLPLLVGLAKTDKSPSVRLGAAAAAADVAMRYRTELTAEARAAIDDALKGYDPGKNPSLLLVLAAVTTPKDLERLGRLLRDPRSDVRAAAATALRRLASEAAVTGLEDAVRGWLDEGRHTPDAEAELVKLAGEVGWTSLGDALRSRRFRAAAATAARDLALERLAARTDRASWRGLWVARTPEGAVDAWFHVGPEKVAGPHRISGSWELTGGEATLGTLGPAQRIWLPQGETAREGLRVGGRTYWRAHGKELGALVEELSDALESHPRVARALVDELASVEGAPGLRARAVAAWRAGDLDEAWGYVERVLSDKKAGKGDAQILAARIRHAQGRPALATKLLKACIAAAPKKGPLRGQAEAQLEAWSKRS